MSVPSALQPPELGSGGAGVPASRRPFDSLRRRVSPGGARASERRLIKAMLVPGIGFLAVFFLAPLYYIVRFSVALDHVSPSEAIARIQGEELGFTLSLWKLLLGKGVTLKILGVSMDLPLLVLALLFGLLLTGAIRGTRLPRHGGVVCSASFVLLVTPFFTIPFGQHLIRVAQLRSESGYLDLFFKSVSMSITTSIFAVIIAFPVAYYLSSCAGRAKYTWLIVVILPFFTSFFLRIIAWKVVLGSSGLINTGLFSLGVLDKAHPLTFLLYSQFTVIIVLIYAWAPFVVMPMFIALEGVDQRLYEAAADLGASRFYILRHITLPLIAPGMIAGFLFVFIPTLGEFVAPLLVGGTQGFMFGNAISDLFSVSIDWQTGSVLALFLLAVVVLLTAATSRFLRAEGGTV